MKFSNLSYVYTRTVDEALEALADASLAARPLAGGQSLMPMMALRLAQPEVLVDINGIDELDGIQIGDSEVRIGAMTRQTTVERDAALSAALPIVATVVSHIGYRAVRNRGTVGGSLCNADPAGELPALMTLLDASMLVASRGSRRTVAAHEFFAGHYSTALDDNELLIDVRIPMPKGSRTVYGFHEVARRPGDFALAGTIVALDLADDGTVVEADLLAIAGGDRPVRLTSVEQELVGKPFHDDIIAAASSHAAADVTPGEDVHVDNWYRVHLHTVTARRALLDARDRSTR
ncbi:MAG: xanthine dehydrogenase family protein subunit M [Acidimicrobiia bacterium]